MLAIVVILLANFALNLNASRILVVIPSAAYSHVNFARSIYLELASRGHKIVAFHPFQINEKWRNVEEIQVSVDSKLFEADQFLDTYSSVTMLHRQVSQIVNTCKSVYSSPKLLGLINDPDEKFDMVMIEWNVVPCFSLLARKFNATLVGVRSVGLRLEGHDYIANPTNPSYISMAYNRYDPSFLGRFAELLFQIFWRIHHNVYTVPKVQGIVDELFPEIGESVVEMEKSVEIVLVNTNYLIYGARPLVPALIEVGMLSVGTSKVDLDKELKQFLDDSKHGFVLFTFGSLLGKRIFEGGYMEVILDALAGLPYNVVWKIANDTVKPPKNVLLWEWLPQEAILAHPNIKCIISHVGFNTMQEAIYHRVPIVAVPLLFDQPYNAHRVEYLGVGKKLDFNSLDSKTFKEAIVEVSTNTSYRKNLEYLMELIEGQQMKPMDKAVWWIEYVLRHKGAPHIRSPAVHMGWFTYLMLDVLTAFAVIVLLCVKVFTMLCAKKDGPSKQSKKYKTN